MDQKNIDKKIYFELTPEQFQSLVKDALKDFGLRPTPVEKQVFTINAVAKRLGMAHNTVKKLCRNGIIKTTKCGRIPEDALSEYLENKTRNS